MPPESPWASAGPSAFVRIMSTNELCGVGMD